MSKINQRQFSIELFRVVLMLLIIWGHLIIYGIPERLINGVFYDVKLIIQSFTIIGVNCFVIISGYYGIKFKLNKLASMILQAVFYSVLISSLYFIFYTHAFDVKLFFKFFFPISLNMWWFLSTYLILYIVSPIINKGIENLEQNVFRLVLILLFLVNCFSGWIFGGFETKGGYSFLHFLTIYIFAKYVSFYNIQIKNSLIYFIAISLLNALLAIATHYVAPGFISKFYIYNNPLLILSVFLLFSWFNQKQIKENKFIYKIATTSLAVYLIHANGYVFNLIEIMIPKMFVLNKYLVIVILFPILSIIIYLVSTLMEEIRLLFLKPVNKKIEYFLNKKYE